MPIPVYRQSTATEGLLDINAPLVADWLVEFLRDECVRKRGMRDAVIGLSGGVDSAVSAYLAARAFGPENVHCFLLPYRTSSPESLAHAKLVVDDLGVNERTIEITAMVDGYAEDEISATRLGNMCARVRTAILFDQSAKLGGLPLQQLRLRLHLARALPQRERQRARPEQDGRARAAPASRWG